MIDRYSYKNIWKIAYPIILGSLAQDIITVVDTAFIGRLGEIPLGAVALGGIFYLSLIMMGVGYGIGIQVILARRFGRNEYAGIGVVWQNAIISLLLLATGLFGFLRLGLSEFLSAFIESNEVRTNTELFLSTRLWGVFAAFANISFRSFYIGIANTKIISYTTVLMALVNLFFDYALIFGNANCPELGVKGAAMASVIAEYSALAVFMFFTFINPKYKRFKMINVFSLSLNTLFNIFRIAFPTMIQTFISFSSWFVFFLLIEKMGQQPLAVSNIIRSIYIIFLLPIMGFSSATSSLVSFAIGKEHVNWIKIIIKRTLLLTLITVGIIVSVGLLFSNSIIAVFTNDTQLIHASLPVFYIVSVAAFFVAFGFIMFNAMTGTGNTIAALVIEVIALFVYLTGTFYMVKFKFGISQIWMLEIVYGIMLGLFSVLYFKIFNWRKNSNKTVQKY